MPGRGREGPGVPEHVPPPGQPGVPRGPGQRQLVHVHLPRLVLRQRRQAHRRAGHEGDLQRRAGHDPVGARGSGPARHLQGAHLRHLRSRRAAADGLPRRTGPGTGHHVRPARRRHRGPRRGAQVGHERQLEVRRRQLLRRRRPPHRHPRFGAPGARGRPLLPADQRRRAPRHRPRALPGRRGRHPRLPPGTLRRAGAAHRPGHGRTSRAGHHRLPQPVAQLQPAHDPGVASQGSGQDRDLVVPGGGQGRAR